MQHIVNACHGTRAIDDTCLQCRRTMVTLFYNADSRAMILYYNTESVMDDTFLQWAAASSRLRMATKCHRVQIRIVQNCHFSLGSHCKQAPSHLVLSSLIRRHVFVISAFDLARCEHHRMNLRSAAWTLLPPSRESIPSCNGSAL